MYAFRNNMKVLILLMAVGLGVTACKTTPLTDDHGSYGPVSEP